MTIVPLLLCLAQAAPSGTIAGQVVDGATHKPIVAAVVTLSGPSLLGVSTPDRPVRVVTNANGGFVFAGLAPGSYEVIATKGGYADGEPGRQRPGGDAPLVEIPAQRSSVGVVVPMWRYGVIAGSILDDAGEPVVNLQVRALRRLPGGRRYGNPLTTFTDDRGVYRIGGLVPGDYLVVASPPSDATVAARRAGTPADRAWLFPPVFYPAVSSVAQAQPISLTAGEERGGVDVHVDWTAAARVTGMILEEGAAVVEATVSLVPAGAELVPSNTVAPSTMTDEDGRFVLPAVVPGVYTLRASGGRGTRGWTRLPIAVPRQGLEDVVAVMKPPLKITARTRFDGASPTPLIGSVSFVAMPFALQPVDGQLEGVSLAGSIGPNGVAATEGFMPGRYRVIPSDPPSGWMLRGAMLDGVDVSETPFEFSKDVPDLVLVYTDRISRVTGRVESERVEASVLVFPADAAAWADAPAASRRFRKARVGTSGEFTITALPAGEYDVIAVPESQAADWREPAALDAMARVATRVSIAEGDTHTLALRVFKDLR